MNVMDKHYFLINISRMFQSQLTAHGETMEIGLNAQRAVEVEPKFEPEKLQLKLLTEEHSVMEQTLMLVFAMNSRVQVNVPYLIYKIV